MDAAEMFCAGPTACVDAPERALCAHVGVAKGQQSCDRCSHGRLSAGRAAHVATSSYCGYVKHGGIEPLMRFGDDALLVWNHAQRLPSSLDGLRAALFFESRKWHHFPDRLDADSERYLRALVAAIGEMSGGVVRDDRKSFVMNTKAALQRYRNHD